MSCHSAWLLILAVPLLLNSQPQPFQAPLSPRIANYAIDVTLIPKDRLLKAKETLIWHNKTIATANDLQFHLYLNGFRNNRSTFMSESGSRHHNAQIDDDGWGYIQVERLALMDGTDLTDSMQFIQPDDANKDDKTVFQILLPRPVAPGQSITVVIDFTAQLPQPPIARTGAKEEFFFIGQWFPKIGVLENSGWNCHQFHYNSEFYADYGVYDVRMTVPQKNLLGATGTCVSIDRHPDSTATHYYHAEDVHDFAWTTSPDFVEFKDKAQDVEIRALVQKDHLGLGLRHLAAAKVAVEYFQNWYGDYPYPNLTVVDPRRGADGAGGMEYPTLITAGTVYGLPEGSRLLESVIIHEFGHNFWYHLVANNEFEEAWLDEGINTYSEMQIFKDRYGPNGDLIDLFGIKLNDLQRHRQSNLAAPPTDQIVQPSWSYYSSGTYGANSYSKPGLVLLTLHNYLGAERMSKVMRTFFERWKFKHPHTQDFISVVNDVTGENLNWFFDQALFTNKTLDYGFDRLTCEEMADSAGYDFTLFAAVRTDSLVKKTGSLPINKIKKTKTYETMAYVRRFGQFVFPVEIEFQFEDGEKIRELWDGQANWKQYRFIRDRKLCYATVDPDHKIPLDVNVTNNSRTVKSQNLTLNRLSARLMFLVQFFLDQPEVLALLYTISTPF